MASRLTQPFLLGFLLIQPWIAVVLGHYPHDTIDSLAVSEDGNQVFVAVRQVLLQSTDSGSSWKYVRAIPGTIKSSYMAFSPYDEELYIYSKGAMSRSTDLIEWEDLNVDACEKEYYDYLKRRTAFTVSGAIIAGNGKVYKDDRIFRQGIREIVNSDFNNCPALSAVPNSQVVYAGGVSGLMRSVDGGITWTLIVGMADIIDVVATETPVFVMTTTFVCYLTVDNGCNDMGLPDTTTAEKVRAGPSPPTGISWKDGVLYVTRANSYAVYYTSNFGGIWNSRSQPDDFVTLGHSGLDAWEFEEAEEFTHVDGNYVGGWLGTFRTNDGGNSWTYLDTIRKAITFFGITKAKPENGGQFTAVACTYSFGCYQGPPNNMNRVSPGFYYSLHLSPTYDVDGVGFHNKKKKLERLDGSQVFLPTISPGAEVSVKSVVFSPAFDTDSTMFVAGYNLGVLASFNKGATFSASTSDFDGYDVIRLVLSPNFPVDGTMACLVDPDFDGKKKSLGSVMYVYLSRNAGATWDRLEPDTASNAWRDIIIVLGDDQRPIVVALKKNGILFDHTTEAGMEQRHFMMIKPSGTPLLRPQGFGYDGLAVSPDGRTLASGFAEGGVEFGSVDLHIMSDRYYSRPGPFANEVTEIPIVFAKAPLVDDVIGRTFSSKIVFSSEFETDDTIFAADMFSIYRSTNKGRNWDKLFSVNA